MAIKWLSSKRIEGLTADTKPTTGVETGTVFKDIQTGDNYTFIGGSWIIEPGGNLDSLTDVDTTTTPPTNNQVLTYNSTGSKWVPATAPGSSGGEANLGSNVGTAGVGVFKDKTGVTLRFKKINAGTGGKVTITDDTGNDEVDIQVVDASETQKGAVELAASGESAASLAVQSNDIRLIPTSAMGKEEYLYIIYIDTADSNKYKALNLSNDTVTDSGSSTDVLSLFNTVVAAASTAGKPIFVDKGFYKFSAAPTIAGKWIHIKGSRVAKTPNGSRGHPTYETIFKKAYTDNTNPFFNFDGTSSWTMQIWEDIVIEGKDSNNDGTGTFDDGGIGFQVKSAPGPSPPALSEIYDFMRNVTICHFGTGIKLMKCYQLTFHDLSIYKCGTKGIHLTNDGSAGQCVEIRFNGGEVRFAPTNAHVECATHTKFDQMLLEGDINAPYTLVNAIKIDTDGYDTRVDKCSFENNVTGGITIISDGGHAGTFDSNRFGGLIWTTQTVYNATSTASKNNFINNTIEPYANNGTATILLSAGCKHMNIIGNHVQESATNTALVITDSSGNSTTNLILGNTSGANMTDNSIGNNSNFLSPVTIANINDNYPLKIYNNITGIGNPYYSIGLSFDLQSSTGVRKAFGRIFSTSDSHTNGAEDTWVGVEYMMGGTMGLRAMFYNNGIVVGPNGQRVRFESNGLTADRTYNTENFNGRLLNHNSPLLQSPLVKRSGTVQPGHGTAVGTVGVMDGLCQSFTPTGAGSNTVSFDTTEGRVINYQTSSASGVVAGLLSPTAGGGLGRRLFGGKMTCRFKLDSTTSARFYFGLTSATTLPISESPLGNTDHGIIVGFNAADTNYQIRTNDGATSVTTTAMTGPIAKTGATAFHTIEISWTASGNYSVSYDGGTAQTISTDLPATTADLYPNLMVQTSAVVQRTLTLKGLYIEVDK